jgi:DNA invertase Pin-like site-specific DNA recombinase
VFERRHILVRTAYPTSLTELGVGFVSLTEALDLTTPTGRAMAGMLAVFAEFERASGSGRGSRDHGGRAARTVDRGRRR